MKSIENVTRRIIGDAEISATEIKARADKDVEIIKKEAQKEIEEYRLDQLGKAKLESDDIKRRYASIASLEGRKTTLTARQELIDEAFEKALAELESARRDEATYVKVLAHISAPYITPTSVIVLDPVDYEKFAKPLATAICGGELKALFAVVLDKINIEPGKIGGGGLIIKNGDIEMNLTFPALLRSYREELEGPVAEALFG